MGDFVKGMPNPDELQDHIKTMLDGKLGRLAQDIAAETASDMDFTREVQDAFAIESYNRSINAWIEGNFDNEIISDCSSSGKI